MPILPTVDYSPILSALSGRRDAQQANYAEDFKKIQKKEETRQMITGAIEGAAAIFGQVYSGFEQAGLAEAKVTAIAAQNQTAEKAKNDVYAGNTKQVPALNEDGSQQMLGGKPVLIAEMPEDVKTGFEQQRKSIEEKYKYLPRVKEFALAQLETRQNQYNQSAVAFFDEKNQKALAVTTQELYGIAMDQAVNTGDFGAVEDFIKNSYPLESERTARIDAATEEWNFKRNQVKIAQAANISAQAAAEAARNATRERLTPEQQAAADRQAKELQYTIVQKQNELAALNEKASTGNAAADAKTAQQIADIEQQITILSETRASKETSAAAGGSATIERRNKIESDLLAEREELLAKRESSAGDTPQARQAVEKEVVEGLARIDNELKSIRQGTTPTTIDPTEQVQYEKRLADYQAQLEESKKIPPSQDTTETIAERARLEGEVAEIKKKLEDPGQIGRTYSSEDQLKLEAYAAQANAQVVARAVTYAESNYDPASEDPDKAITAIASRFQNPEARAAAEEAMRKVQTSTNMDASLKQFNQARDDGNLANIKAIYETVQYSRMFKGDEGTRSEVMSWYEGLIGNITGSAGAGEKVTQDQARGTIEKQFNMWQEGSGITGRDINATVDRFLSQGVISPEQAKEYWNRITTKAFPNAKATVDAIPAMALSLTGFKKKPTDQAGILKVSTMEATLSAMLQKKLDQGGGSLTAEQIAATMQQVKDAAMTSELSGIKKPFDWFGLDKNTDEKGIARTKAMFDTQAGDTVIGTDVNDQMVIVAAEPDKVRKAIEGVSQWETQTLESRYGIKTVASRQAPSPTDERDITGSRIHTGEDGNQYMFLAKGDKMLAYTRSDPSKAWKPAAQKEEFNTGFDARYPMPTIGGITVWSDGQITVPRQRPNGNVMPMTESAWNNMTLKEKQELYAKNNLQAVKK